MSNETLVQRRATKIFWIKFGIFFPAFVIATTFLSHVLIQLAPS